MKVYFYYDRAVGAGLPQFNLSGSTSAKVLTSFPYTILGNQDLAAGDAQVRNVTIALRLGAGIIVRGSQFHINFFLMSGIELFAISELELCTNGGMQDR